MTERSPSYQPGEVRHEATLRSVETHESYFGGSVRIVEAVPVDQQTGEVTATNLPDIWYGHGAGWGQEEPTVQQIARMGRRAFGLQFAGDRQGERQYMVGNGSTLQAVTESELKILLGEASVIVPTYQIAEAASLAGVIAERNHGPIHALAQSKSAGGCTIAAFVYPEMFEAITLAFPGNLTGPQTGPIPLRMARDGIVRRLYPPKPDGKFGANDGPGFARRFYEQVRMPSFRADAYALRYSNLALLLHSMRQKDNAPPVTLVAGLKDRIFPVENYLKSLVASTDIDTMIVVPGGHGIYKREEILAKMIEQFSAMDLLKAEREEARRIGQSVPSQPLRERILLPPGIRAWRARRILKLADELDARTETQLLKQDNNSSSEESNSK